VLIRPGAAVAPPAGGPVVARRATPRRLGRLVNIGLPYLWLGLFFLAPFLIVLQISLAEPQLAQPPYSSLLTWVDRTTVELRLNLGNFALVAGDALYRDALVKSLWVAFVCTLLCLLLGYPMAYAVANAGDRWRMPLLMLVILPFWTSFLIRVYAWIGILKQNGLLNNFLLWTGLIDQPLAILHTPLAVYIGVVYSYLPFMILPLYANLVRLDPPALAARHHRREHAGVHTRGGRVRHPRPAGRPRIPNAGPHALDGVLLQHGLAPGGRAGDHDPGASGGPVRRPPGMAATL